MKSKPSPAMQKLLFVSEKVQELEQFVDEQDRKISRLEKHIQQLTGKINVWETILISKHKLRPIDKPAVNKLNFDELHELYCLTFNLEPYFYKSKSRKEPLQWHKNLFRYIMKAYLGFGVTKIGRQYCGIDHGSVINSINEVSDGLETKNPFYCETIAKFEKVVYEAEKKRKTTTQDSTNS